MVTHSSKGAGRDIVTLHHGLKKCNPRKSGTSRVGLASCPSRLPTPPGRGWRQEKETSAPDSQSVAPHEDASNRKPGKPRPAGGKGGATSDTGGSEAARRISA